MTAEIAVLNKTAVALAADSAVTISAGSKEEKIFNTAEKLFELCDHNPIGIMIYNGTSFMEIPLPVLIRKFRTEAGSFAQVLQAGEDFLKFLHAWCESAPPAVADSAIAELVEPVLERISTRFQESFQRRVAGAENPDFRELIESTLSEEIEFAHQLLTDSADATFIGGTPELTDSLRGSLRLLVDKHIQIGTEEQKVRTLEVAQLTVLKDFPAPRLIGVVVAGFGSEELFPTLVAYEIDGCISGKLKYRRTQAVDIDRSGPKAFVLPFAQKDMVERFLYGLDEEIENHIRWFCENSIRTLRNKMSGELQFETELARTDWTARADAAEAEFLEGLGTQAFGTVRRVSRSEIEDMVEFMPKPELAKMAESLVNLTSLKRQVSRGLETVGGPVDVAVISAAEGFVWVKRKHYFPPELNVRYFERVRT